jgi:hypothetical protein
MTIEKTYYLTLKLHDSQSGRLIKGQEVTADSVGALFQETQDNTKALLQDGLKLPTPTVEVQPTPNNSNTSDKETHSETVSGDPLEDFASKSIDAFSGIFADDSTEESKNTGSGAYLTSVDIEADNVFIYLNDSVNSNEVSSFTQSNPHRVIVDIPYVSISSDAQVNNKNTGDCSIDTEEYGDLSGFLSPIASTLEALPCEDTDQLVSDVEMTAMQGSSGDFVRIEILLQSAAYFSVQVQGSQVSVRLQRQ